MKLCWWMVACPLLASAAAAGGACGAEPLAPEGNFSVSYTLATPSPSPPLDVGEGRELTTNRYLITAYNDAGSGFLDLTAGECLNVRFAVRGKRTVDTHSYCHFKDRDGDELFAEYRTGAPKPTHAITIEWTFVSGTGKYDGITGRADGTNSSNLDDQGSFQGAGKMVGAYKIVRASGDTGKRE